MRRLVLTLSFSCVGRNSIIKCTILFFLDRRQTVCAPCLCILMQVKIVFRLPLLNLYFFLTLFVFQTFRFLDGRCHRAHLLKRNPRKVNWTVLYRRKHKKGQEEETSKKRTKRTHKFQRAVVGATLQDIMAKRNQKPEVRKAQREQAIR